MGLAKGAKGGRTSAPFWLRRKIRDMMTSPREGGVCAGRIPSGACGSCCFGGLGFYSVINPWGVCICGRFVKMKEIRLK